MTQKFSIGERRNFLLKEGAEHLSNVELLKILRKTNTPLNPESITLDLMHRLLDHNNNLSQMEEAASDWCGYIEELKKTNEVMVKASIELQRRALTDILKKNNALSFSELTRYFLKAEFSERGSEVLGGLFLNQYYQLLGFEYLFYDSIDDTYILHQNIIYKEILFNAERYGGVAVILARNNLSSETNPTFFDIELTQWFIKELGVTSVQLLDYWIISDKVQISLAKQGIMDSLKYLGFAKSICNIKGRN
jgi:DNA repair protein RadC